MLEDSLKSLRVSLDNYISLGVVGRVVRVDNRLVGFSFGFKLNQETFCVLYEITELAFKGLAQFIFRKLSEELKDYKYVNIMDDSGLPNLKRTKLSYHPVRLVPSYIISRKNV